MRTHPKRILTLKCTGMSTLLLALAVSSTPDFLGCMNEAVSPFERTSEATLKSIGARPQVIGLHSESRRLPLDHAGNGRAAELRQLLSEAVIP